MQWEIAAKLIYIHLSSLVVLALPFAVLIDVHHRAAATPSFEQNPRMSFCRLFGAMLLSGRLIVVLALLAVVTVFCSFLLFYTPSWLETYRRPAIKREEGRGGSHMYD